MRKVNKNGKIVLYCGAYLSSEVLCKNSKRYDYNEIEKIVLNSLKKEVEDFLDSRHKRENIYKKCKN